MVALLAGCAGTDSDTKDITVNWKPERIYKEAKDELNSGNYDSAIKYYEKLIARYPYGRLAQQSLIETAYANYKQNEREPALAASERFIKEYPVHPALDYVYYLKGLILFNENQGLFSSISNQDMTERDPKSSRESFEAFKTLVNRYPDSQYAADASLRMRYLIHALAENELHVARFYYRRGAYVASLNRAKTVLQQYQQTDSVQEALAIAYRSYDKLGMTELRDDSLRVLNLNYPQSPFLDPNYQRKNQIPWWQIWNHQPEPDAPWYKIW